jgi:hypothetical protein
MLVNGTRLAVHRRFGDVCPKAWELPSFAWNAGQMRLLLALFCVVICAAMALPASFDPTQIREGGLTGDQAKQVLVVVLKHERYKIETGTVSV